MLTLGIIALLVSLLVVCSTVLLHQHNASKREERRLALLDKVVDIGGTYIYHLVGTPYPSHQIAEENELLEDGESELAGLIGSGSGSGSGSKSGNGSGRGVFDGSGSNKQQRLNAVYQFYTRYPDASLADGIQSLGISGAALSRLHASLVDAGNLEPFPKNR